MQQNQWIGAQKLLDISMAYASKVDSSGKPLEVTTATPPSTTTQPTQAAPTVSFSFAAAPAATAQAATVAPVINKQCEFEVILYNPSSNYKQKPYVRPAHVGYRRWLQVTDLNKNLFTLVLIMHLC